jgi:hypothetical protein
MAQIDPVTRDELAAAVLAALPGWRYERQPEGTGWAPDRHLRAVLRQRDQGQDVFIKKCWSPQGEAAERFVYEVVAPIPGVGTPDLLAVVTTGSAPDVWLVMRGLGGRHYDGSRAGDTQAMLTMLGRLHGYGASVLQGDSPLPGPLAVFEVDECRQHSWEALLSNAIGSPELGIEEWMLAVNRALWPALAREPATLLHGDPDVSNGLATGDGYALVDWERAMIGPAALDLGRATDGTAWPTDLTVYQAAYVAAGGDLSDDRLRNWSELASAHDSLRWMCHYLANVGGESRLPDDWRREHYEPRLVRLGRLRERAPYWLAGE